MEEDLRRLWAEGYSCSQIASRIGGITRNAVIGKAARLKLPHKTTTCRIKPGPKPKAKHVWRAERKPRQPSIRDIIRDGTPIPPPQETDIARVAFIDLEAKHCRFIALDRPAGPYVKQFCGDDVVPGLSWCRAHAARCLNLPNPSRPAPAAPVPAEPAKVLEAA